MEKPSIEQIYLDYLATKQSEEAFDQEVFMAKYPELEAELVQHLVLWESMDSLKVPPATEEMHQRFYAMLSGFESGLQAQRVSPFSDLLNNLQAWWWNLNKQALAYGIAIFCVGILSGYMLQRSQSGKAMASLNSEVTEMREIATLSMLKQPSVSSRLQAVSLSQEFQPHAQFSAQDRRITEALLTTLREDPNINVRLACIDVLLNWAEHPEVRRGMIASIPQQESPLVQLALAEAMVILGEKKAVAPLEQLIQDQQTPPEIKSRLAQSVEVLL